MEKLLLILLCFTFIFSSCEENPCNGNCGTINEISVSSGMFTIQNIGGQLVSVQNGFILRIENECSLEQANFTFLDNDYYEIQHLQVGDNICYYQ